VGWRLLTDPTFRQGREAIERELANAPEDLLRRIRRLPSERRPTWMSEHAGALTRGARESAGYGRTASFAGGSSARLGGELCEVVLGECHEGAGRG
jgi:hypothetical protein